MQRSKTKQKADPHDHTDQSIQAISNKNYTTGEVSSLMKVSLKKNGSLATVSQGISPIMFYKRSEEVEPLNLNKPKRE